MISDTEVAVQLVGSRSGTRLGLRAKANGGASAETRITLSLDRLSFNLIVDEKVQALMNELQRLVAAGASNVQFKSLARKMDSALQLSSRYRPFVDQVKRSAAFTIVTTARSLTTSASPEEIKQHPALVVLRSTAGLLAPSIPSDATIGSGTLTGKESVNLSQRENLPRFSLSFSSKSAPLQPGCVIVYQTCMNLFNCGGHGQPIDALCWLGCVIAYVICEIVT
ncbi:MAG: hypothetical protein NZ823_15455 [Blastocatellia bacterium]|nr:hypothetical protein [Blastocatellia bacterium]